MQVGDLVKYESRHTGLQNRAGLVVEFDRLNSKYCRVLVLWSGDWSGLSWDWMKDLRAVK